MHQVIKNAFRLQRAIRGKDLFEFESNTKYNATYGNKGASWTINTKKICEKPVVYSFGVGTDVSFDLSLIEKHNAVVHAFDPTPKSIEWLKNQQLPERFHFHNFGIGKTNETVNFYVPNDPKLVSGSIIPGHDRIKIKAGLKTINYIVNYLKDKCIDILKMDIEGAEYDVIEDIINLHVPVKQILIEFHHRMPSFCLQDTKVVIQKLKQAGYKIGQISFLGEEYSFYRD